VFSVFDLLGDLGGLVDALRLIFGVLAVPFSTFRMDAIITNRLYHISAGSSELADNIEKFSKHGHSNKTRTRTNGDIEIDVPFCLDWELFYHTLTCCFCTSNRRNEFKEYKKAMALGRS
jgi:hypothetical protein